MGLTIEESVEALAACAAERGVVLTHTTSMKLLFLADLDAVESREDPFTGVDWVWHDYGPWSKAFYAAFAALVAAGTIVQQDMPKDYFGNAARRITATATASGDPARESHRHIEAVLVKYGHLNAKQLVELVYETPPMLAAQEGGERGVRLDLFAGRRHETSLTKMAAALDETDPGLYERDPNSPRVTGPPADGKLLTLRRSLSRRI